MHFTRNPEFKLEAFEFILIVYSKLHEIHCDCKFPTQKLCNRVKVSQTSVFCLALMKSKATTRTINIRNTSPAGRIKSNSRILQGFPVY